MAEFRFYLVFSLVVLTAPILLAIAWVIGRGGVGPNARLTSEDAARLELIEPELRAARRRLLVAAVAATIAAACLLTLAVQFGPFWAVAVPIPAVIAGLITYTWWPAGRRNVGDRRAASLVARDPADSISRASILWWVLTVLLLIAAVASTLILRVPAQGLGVQRSFRCVDVEGMEVCELTQPMLTLVLGLPLLLLAGLLAVVTWSAVRKVSQLPVLPSDEFESEDQRWRSGSARVIVNLSAGALLISGTALLGVSWFIRSTPGSANELTQDLMVVVLGRQPWGQVVATLSLIVFGSAISQAVSLPRRALSVPSPEPGR